MDVKQNTNPQQQEQQIDVSEENEFVIVIRKKTPYTAPQIQQIQENVQKRGTPSMRGKYRYNK